MGINGNCNRILLQIKSLAHNPNHFLRLLSSINEYRQYSPRLAFRTYIHDIELRANISRTRSIMSFKEFRIIIDFKWV